VTASKKQEKGKPKSNLTQHEFVSYLNGAVTINFFLIKDFRAARMGVALGPRAASNISATSMSLPMHQSDQE
jgi:hypothetical protein